MSILNTDIKFLPSIGEKRAKLLGSELSIFTFEDLALYTPFRYIDRTKFHTIKELMTEESAIDVQVRGVVQGVQIMGRGAASRLVVTIYDGSGIAEVVWFRSTSWVLKSIESGKEYIFFGRPSMFNGHLSFVHPEFEPYGASSGAAGKAQGVYRTTETLKKNMLGSRTIAKLQRILWDKIKGLVEESLPPWLIARYSLIGRQEALYQLHFPQSATMLNSALYRLKFEELFFIQLNLLQSKGVRTERSVGYVFESVGRYFNDFYNNVLSFELTDAQKRVLREIRLNTQSGHQMNRLLQGDVGSGKTIVALLSALLCVDNGGQCALMAPTEILASQHFESIAPLCKKIGVSIALLTGSTKKKDRDTIHAMLRSGELDILIGTHALIEDPVQFLSLRLVIIDEQHRFGVMQRAKLHTKGGEIAPHILVMTATPIPRTLSMTLYGDLDVSVIDELPPGRKPIKTLHLKESQRLRIIGFMKEQIALGRQCYVVYPLIDESEKTDLISIEEGADMISQNFPYDKGYSNIVVHGKMSQELKDFGMEKFRSGEVDILIATTVIEVGVNVPNATVMVIENAERFGLSQLHQLRGRVGRGGEQSWCILITGDRLSSQSKARMEVMVETTDGFVIAQRDMELRGAGDIEGTRQSGESIDIHFSDLAKDGKILDAARDLAVVVLERDPMLSAEPNRLLRFGVAKLRTRYGAELLDIDLSKIS